MGLWMVLKAGKCCRGDTIFVNILDIGGRADSNAVAVAGVVVTTIEFVHDECCAVAADVLNLGELRVGDNLSGRVPWVTRQDHGSSPRDFFGNLIGVNMIAVFFIKGNGYCCELYLSSVKLTSDGA